MIQIRSLAAALLPLVLAGSVSAQERDRSPNQRPRATRDADRPRTEHRGPGGRAHVPARFPFEFRSIDGTGNNVANPSWGAAETPVLRLLAPAYGDDEGTPSGAGRPGAREISSVVGAQQGSLPNATGASDYLWQWGQFLDHDIVETPVADPSEPFDIPVPTGDPWFDPGGAGGVTIPLDRSAYEVVNGVRQQVNAITAFIDASNVYGSSETRARALRTLDGTGRLATSDGDLLPYNTAGLPNAPSSDPSFFLAGDIRANEQVALTAMHTLFVREHNHWADLLGRLGVEDGDTIYELARALVAAEMQAVTYREFLPVLLGQRALRPYRGYRSDVDPSIANVFGAAAYRFGHSMLSPRLLRLEADGSSIPAGPLALAQAFFDPAELPATGLEPYLRGLGAQVAQEVDALVVDDVRNFLFGPPGAGGFDLLALNVQRGRDHGIGTYNEVRVLVGRMPVSTFAGISMDPDVQAGLARTYAHVNQVDAWVGMLCEEHERGAMVGKTLRRVLADQFERLRDGDRFWYEAYLPRGLVRFVERQTLARIIRRNTGVGRELQENVFVAR
jgi:hypothetical protein